MWIRRGTAVPACVCASSPPGIKKQEVGGCLRNIRDLLAFEMSHGWDDAQWPCQEYILAPENNIFIVIAKIEIINRNRDRAALVFTGACHVSVQLPSDEQTSTDESPIVLQDPTVIIRKSFITIFDDTTWNHISNPGRTSVIVCLGSIDRWYYSRGNICPQIRG